MGKLIQVNSLEEIVQNLKQFLGKPEDVVLRGKVVNVYVAFQAQTPLLIRTEGQGDLTSFRIGDVSVPAIINTKVQAVLRRKTLQVLRYYYDNDEEIKKHVEEIVGGRWECMVRPTGEKTAGYCGKCPACLIYGFAVQRGGGFNVKSRVEGDVYYATVREEEATYTFTRNAVDEATYTTEQALLQDRAVKPGTVFLGKIALKNLTPAELKLVLYSIASLERIGAVVTHFGRVKTRIIGLIGSMYEVGSGYEAVKELLGIKEPVRGYAEIVKNWAKETPGAVGIIVEGLEDLVRKTIDLRETVEDAWSHARVKREVLEKAAGKASSGAGKGGKRKKQG